MRRRRIADLLAACGAVTLAACAPDASSLAPLLATRALTTLHRTLPCARGGTIEVRGTFSPSTPEAGSASLIARGCRWSSPDGLVRLDAPQLLVRRLAVPPESPEVAFRVSGIATWTVDGVTGRCAMNAEVRLSMMGAPGVTATGTPCSTHLVRSFIGLD